MVSGYRKDAEGESEARVGSGAVRQRYQGGTDRRSRSARPVGNRVRRHSRPLKTGGTAEGPAFRPGRTKAGYVFFGPGTRPKESGGNHREPSANAPSSSSTRTDIPRAFYNIAADLPEPPPPPLHPGTGQPIGPADLAPLFPMELIKQVVSTEREIEIPDPVRDAYALYRPSPLYRARRLEKALDTPAHIYYKYEGVSPSGSHKPNTAIAQAFYNKQEGVTRLATETGAGQWGSALAFAGSLFGLEVKVFMVRASYDQKPYRRILMETYGAKVVASPSPDTQYGSSVLAAVPGPHRLARHGHQRGDRGHRHPPGDEVLARLGVRLRAAAPDGDRPGGDRADGDGRRGAGHRHRLRRRRLQLRRAGVPVHRPPAAWRGLVPRHRGRARRPRRA